MMPSKDGTVVQVVESGGRIVWEMEHETAEDADVMGLSIVVAMSPGAVVSQVNKEDLRDPERLGPIGCPTCPIPDGYRGYPRNGDVVQMMIDRESSLWA